MDDLKPNERQVMQAIADITSRDKRNKAAAFDAVIAASQIDPGDAIDAIAALEAKRRITAVDFAGKRGYSLSPDVAKFFEITPTIPTAPIRVVPSRNETPKVRALSHPSQVQNSIPPRTEADYENIADNLVERDYAVLKVMRNAAKVGLIGCTRSELASRLGISFKILDGHLQYLGIVQAFNASGKRGREMIYRIGPVGEELLSRHEDCATATTKMEAEPMPAKSKPKRKQSYPTFQATVYRVLIASPSDVAVERDAIEKVINDWNIYHAEDKKIVLIPIRWEKSAIPEMGGHPQDMLNRQIVDRCNILVGVFWGRIGTKTKNAESGTAEEIERFITSKRPAMLYFSDKKIPPSKLDAKQYDRLKKLKNRYKTGGVNFDYKSTPGLTGMLQHHLTGTLRKLHGTSSNPSPIPSPAPTADVPFIKDLEQLNEALTAGKPPMVPAMRVLKSLTPITIEEWSFRESLTTRDGRKMGSGIRLVAVAPLGDKKITAGLALAERTGTGMEPDHVEDVYFKDGTLARRLAFFLPTTTLTHLRNPIEILRTGPKEVRDESVRLRIHDHSGRVVFEVAGEGVWKPIEEAASSSDWGMLGRFATTSS